MANGQSDEMKWDLSAAVNNKQSKAQERLKVPEKRFALTNGFLSRYEQCC
jgi:hypothetical protein